MNKVLFIGVAGGSGSGKSALCKRLKADFGSDLTVVSCDNYYRVRPEKTYVERSRVNYDHPDAFDRELLLSQLTALGHGEGVNCPIYDYKIHNRSKQTAVLPAAGIIVIDGLFVLAEPAIRERCDIKVFVKTDEAVRLTRRIARDTLERKRSVRSVQKQFYATVQPMHDRFIEPSAVYADLIFEGGAYDETAYAKLLDAIALQEDLL